MKLKPQAVPVGVLGGALLFASAATWAAPVELSAALPAEMKAVVDAFNAKQSAIHVQYLPTPERSDKTLAQLLGGTGPDIQYIGWYEDIDKFIDAGVFQSLTPFINNDGAGNLVSDIPKPVTDRFSRNGQLMGIPEYTHMRAVGINRTYRENAGLALPNSDWDWAAFEAYAKKLIKKDGANKITTQGTSINAAWAVMQGWLGGVGVPLHKDGQPAVMNLDRPEFIDALNTLQRISLANGPYPGIAAGILGGKVAMQSNMASNYAKIMNDSSFTYDTVEVPVGPGGTRAIVVNDASFFMTKVTKHPKEAWAFIKYFLSDEGQTVFMKASGFQPARTSLVNTWREIVKAQWPKITDAWIEPFIHAYGYAQVTDYFTNSQVVTQYLQPTFASILNKGEPAGSAMAAMVPAANAFIAGQAAAK